jgi:predicted nucleotidyltransferase
VPIVHVPIVIALQGPGDDVDLFAKELTIALRDGTNRATALVAAEAYEMGSTTYSGAPRSASCPTMTSRCADA